MKLTSKLSKWLRRNGVAMTIKWVGARIGVRAAWQCELRSRDRVSVVWSAPTATIAIARAMRSWERS